mmetsp:Transcript_17712/g.62056  ORF Transcript_17712/g.62056 Transcript_17712/m.62056 type:complete len:225 (+) Transcript_17712:365-1039(+)
MRLEDAPAPRPAEETTARGSWASGTSSRSVRLGAASRRGSESTSGTEASTCASLAHLAAGSGACPALPELRMRLVGRNGTSWSKSQSERRLVKAPNQACSPATGGAGSTGTSAVCADHGANIDAAAAAAAAPAARGSDLQRRLAHAAAGREEARGLQRLVRPMVLRQPHNAPELAALLATPHYRPAISQVRHGEAAPTGTSAVQPLDAQDRAGGSGVLGVDLRM